MPTLPMTAQMDHVVRYLRQQGKGRSEVLQYFHPTDRENAGAEYDRQRTAAVNKARPGAVEMRARRDLRAGQAVRPDDVEPIDGPVKP